MYSWYILTNKLTQDRYTMGHGGQLQNAIKLGGGGGGGVLTRSGNGPPPPKHLVITLPLIKDTLHITNIYLMIWKLFIWWSENGFPLSNRFKKRVYNLLLFRVFINPFPYCINVGSCVTTSGIIWSIFVQTVKVGPFLQYQNVFLWAIVYYRIEGADS